MSTIKKLGLWNILHYATGYSKSYCKKVVENRRNQEAKGAEVIMSKYNEFVASLDVKYAEELTAEIAGKGIE
jgi:hypothetical protein